MAPVPWRLRVWWQVLHPPVMKTSTPFERRSSRSAPGPYRALARHATNTDRTTMPSTRKKHATPQRPLDPTAGLPPLHLHAAGIDVGSAEHDVAVPRIARQSPCAGVLACRPTSMPWPTGSKPATSIPWSWNARGCTRSPLPNPGSAGFCRPLGQRPPRQTPARPQNRFRRLPVAPTPDPSIESPTGSESTSSFSSFLRGRVLLHLPKMARWNTEPLSVANRTHRLSG